MDNRKIPPKPQISTGLTRWGHPPAVQEREFVQDLLLEY